MKGASSQYNSESELQSLSRWPVIFVVVVSIFVALPSIGIFLLYVFTQLPWFYYSDFRAVEKRLEAIPPINIVDWWVHEDLTLEDFGFTLETPEGARIRLSFFESHDEYWLDQFEHFDGVVTPDSDGEYAVYSRQLLNDHGLAVENLTELLENLPRFILICETVEGEPVDWPGPQGVWSWIDLVG